MKVAFNPQFGSVFRSENNPSFFYRKIHRLSDIYTAHVTNMLNYSSNHLFYPYLDVIPHEHHHLYLIEKEDLFCHGNN